MHVISLSLNYRKATVEEREKVQFNEMELTAALHKLRSEKSILETVMLSTCNRTEVYIVSDQVHTGKYYAQNFLAQWFDVELDTIKRIIDVKVGDEAVEHLFYVTAGLDSMVLGETQILGQIRDAFIRAQNEKTTGTIFNKLFKEAITVAKKGHNDTDISKNAISTSYAAVQLINKIIERKRETKAVVVGAGEMSEQSVINLTSNGIKDITIVNRSQENAKKLAAKYGCTYAAMEELETHLRNTDIVISSTASRNYVITEAAIEDIQKSRAGRPLIMIDIAMPRDIEPSTAQYENVYMYNVDDLQGLIDSNLETRQQEAKKVEAMIRKSQDEFENWVNMLGVTPVIQALRTKALTIHEETFESVERKMPDMTERERTVISKHMKSIINQMLKDPIIYTKEIANDKQAAKKLQEIEMLFGIEDEVSEVREREMEKYRQETHKINTELAYD
ncbi:glutamyl-tRNA reductase [Lacicoccus alkaliphilus]|uniref:Glutamyl-tRNA reductase n=1 Tax=Lacicoccus alkaliphilus DSM 16010 TaxID=1123231 RepID=A0A1M7AXP6_9BACL|nr:glutamyl-tRNA reductase [Salinicoccus alkaliphilus]SHL47493.1 glutamyl-tRNA reductase [Salinicoccus alkaliphilus DSM 16010]